MTEDIKYLRNCIAYSIGNEETGMAESYKEYKQVIDRVLHRLEQDERVIEEFKKECERHRLNCKITRKNKKQNVDEFQYGMEFAYNQFLNLLEQEENWNYEGKYFDDTAEQINHFRKKCE